MSTNKPSKINKLLGLQPPGVVLTSNWLSEQGYSPELLRKYRNSQWLFSIGTGAMIRANDQIDYLGAIYSLQQQLNLSIHPGAKTALSIQGRIHFLDFSEKEIYLFGNAKESLPVWFVNYDWGVKINYYTSSFLPADVGMILTEKKENFDLKISSPARAIIECLFLAPQSQDLMECFQIMQGLNNLHPQKTQQLLELCTSVKVKRLFLYLAEKSGHAWFKYLNVENIDLGKGNRSLVKNGIYIKKYKLTVPREMEKNEYPDL
ncbi:Transcriptional regulator, AbiEi antitoxin, Type IV TA system [Salegentibacter holothuriorum]|uniref:Transcriptional regulator, AbiEi antitoxin, Type IV TA system n=1 Tax=Salegentibacter holothuriorum TaxID=241145 RepID=A0A1T5DQP1_9FLAO|nr:type IV toxin-antitoxin system AbiEi family antitoxin [Salegentibacter holothuriorum]SKB74004.1 Transcriptional regulator, AbiEi antitoxin, Type IV TA system [Salegentibacter holothuriorum]